MLFVYLSDPLVTIGNPGHYSKINQALQAHFDIVAAKLNPPDKIMVAFIPATPTPTPSDILIYFSPVELSLVSNFAGRAHNPLTDAGDGWTSIRPGTPPSDASEVYVKTSDPDQLAVLAFHEAMHNKLTMGQAMHGTYADSSRMAAKVTGPNTPVTPADANDMAVAFRRPVTQWTGGIAIGLARRARRDSGDSLWFS
jgi:hypothetical protein